MARRATPMLLASGGGQAGVPDAAGESRTAPAVLAARGAARTVLIATGGTGGHLFPGLAVADELRRRDPATRVAFVGTARGLETRLVPAAGYELKLLPILPLNRVGLVRLVKGLAALPWALLRATALLVRERPAVVFGAGGYAGGPLVLMAALLRIPTVVLEPNARPGFTNRVLRRFVTRAACAYDEACATFGKRGVVTGNPVRAGFAATPARTAQAPFALLVFGGSQGSRILNQAMIEALPLLPGPARLRIVHQTGAAMYTDVAQRYAAAEREGRVTPFIDDMAGCIAEADLVVSRSGATTCAELTAAGKPALLVPFARAADDHQRVNASTLEAAGAAVVIEESVLTGPSLARAVSELIQDPDRLVKMAQAARGLGRPDAAARVADLVEALW